MHIPFTCSKGVSQTKLKPSGLSADLVGSELIQSSARGSIHFSRDLMTLNIHNLNSDCWGPDIKME